MAQVTTLDSDFVQIGNKRPDVWRDPEPRDRYDLVVIGAGPAGLTAAWEASGKGATVALIERDRLGGNSLNAGSVPSKALARSGRYYADLRAAWRFGARGPEQVKADFRMAMERTRAISERLGRERNARRLFERGVDLYFGAATFCAPDAVTVNGVALTFRKALIATGARPVIPAIAGLRDAGFLTSDSVFDLAEPPGKLMMIGGGPLGCELAQALKRLDVDVVLVQKAPRFLPKEERDAAFILNEALRRDGVELHVNTEVVAVEKSGARKCATMRCAGHESTIEVDEIVVAAGRAPRIDGLNLEAAQVRHDRRDGVHVDAYLQTSNPAIYAAGDICLGHRFTHVAEASARVALRNALGGADDRMSALTIPWCAYTDPEVAHVGLDVQTARGKRHRVKTYAILMQDVDRAVLDGEDEGFVKISVDEDSDEILGATIVARHAGEMIGLVAAAMTFKLGLRDLSRVVAPYPTQVQAVLKAAEVFMSRHRSAALESSDVRPN